MVRGRVFTAPTKPESVDRVDVRGVKKGSGQADGFVDFCKICVSIVGLLLKVSFWFWSFGGGWLTYLNGIERVQMRQDQRVDLQ